MKNIKALKNLSDLLNSIEVIKSNVDSDVLFDSHWITTGKPEMFSLTKNNSEKLHKLKLRYAKDLLKLLDQQKNELSKELKKSL